MKAWNFLKCSSNCIPHRKGGFSMAFSPFFSQNVLRVNSVSGMLI